MDQRQLLTFTSLGANPEIGITLARRNRTEALVWGIALAVFLLGVALTTAARAAEGALVLGLALASALVPLAWDTVSMALLCNGVFYAASLLVPYYLAAGLVRWILRRLQGLAGRIAGPPRPRLPWRWFWPWSRCSRQRAQAQQESKQPRRNVRCTCRRLPCPTMRSSCPTM